MFSNLIHPALSRLLRQQTNARFAKVVAMFKSPRRQILSLLAVVLGLVWLGQAILSVVFREAADPGRLATWIPLSFLGYSVWHLIKTISVKPVEPFDWTPAELELLCGAPLARRQLVTYRLVSIFSAALVKSLLFSVLMIPDLHFFVVGFVGMLLGLLLVDLIRILIELVCYGLTKLQLQILRAAVFLTVAGVVVVTFVGCLNSQEAGKELATPGALLFALHYGQALIGNVETYFWLLKTPFMPATNVIMAESIHGGVIIDLGLSCGLVSGLVAMAVWLDGFVLARKNQRDAKWLASIAIGKRFDKSEGGRIGQQALAVPFRWRGAGSIGWRQMLGAWNYRGSLVVSLGVPVILCGMPLLAKHGQMQMLLNLVAGVVFYSFLLLPSALMLDFRRDVDRLGVLKSLPISPLAVTLGQLAVPVLLCSAYQWIVLGVAASMGAISVKHMIVTGFLLLPVCVLIFSIENLIFMVAPYRRNQEGLDVFLRTILTFTAKGVLFAVALAGTLAWAFLCRSVGGQFSDPAFAGGLIFGIGVWVSTCLVSGLAIHMLTKLYRDFDPSLDAPAIS